MGKVQLLGGLNFSEHSRYMRIDVYRLTSTPLTLKSRTDIFSVGIHIRLQYLGQPKHGHRRVVRNREDLTLYNQKTPENSQLPKT